MKAIHFIVLVLIVLLPVGFTEASVISSPGAVWSSDNSAVQLVWIHSRDVILSSSLNIEKENKQIIRYDRFAGIQYLHTNFTNRVTVVDSSDSGVYSTGITIAPVSVYDHGGYCLILVGTVQVCDATVVVLGEPRRAELVGELPVKVGDDVILQCAAVSKTLPSQFAPVMTYVWNINGTTYSPGDDAGLPERHSFRDADAQLNKELFIASVERDDIYTYACQARENGSSFLSGVSVAYILLPYYAPYNVQLNPPPPEAIVEYGSLGPVLCSAVCNPSCSYSWHKWGAQVSSNAELIVPNVTRDDHGVYECLPDNTLTGGDTSEFSLSVYYGPAVDTFTIASHNDPIIEGDHVRFTCETDSRPTPVITMYTPRGDVLASSSHNQSLEHTQLDIDCLDSGQYKCQAFNSETGKYHNRMQTVTIHCAPRKNRTSAREVAAKGGDSVLFNITTVAYPQPAFTWFFNGTELSDVSYTIKTHTMGRLEPDVFISSSLTLNNITQENFGNYSVAASNTQGTMEGVVFLLTAVGIPDGPREFRVAHSIAVSITMQWTSGWNRGGEQVFTLMYRRSDSVDSFTSITDISDPGQGETVTAKAIGLLPDTSFDFIVQAINLYGASQSQLVTHSTTVKPNFGSESDDSFSIVVTGGVATIMWSLHRYSGPITHVDVNSCVSDSTYCILTTNVSPNWSTVEVAIPEGSSSYTFEFLVYDGEDLLSTVNHSVGDSGQPAGIIVGVVIAVLLLAVVATSVGVIAWRRVSCGGSDTTKTQTSPSNGAQQGRKSSGEPYENILSRGKGSDALAVSDAGRSQQELDVYETITEPQKTAIPDQNVYEHPHPPQIAPEASVPHYEALRHSSSDNRSTISHRPEMLAYENVNSLRDIDNAI